jgi:hypothetical protein
MQHLVDIDGDGVVDAAELALWQTIMQVKGIDEDGDGTVDDAETYVAQQIAGRKLMADKFVKRQQGKMWRFHTAFKGMNDQQVIDDICLAEDFMNTMSFLKAREFRLRQESATFQLGEDSLYTNCLAPEVTHHERAHEQGSTGYSHNHHSVAPWMQHTQRVGRGQGKTADVTKRQNIFLQRSKPRADSSRVPTPLRLTEKEWKLRGGNAISGIEGEIDPNKADRRYQTHLGKLGQPAGLHSPVETNYLPDKRTVRVARSWQSDYKPGEVGGWPFQEQVA